MKVYKVLYREKRELWSFCKSFKHPKYDIYPRRYFVRRKTEPLEGTFLLAFKTLEDAERFFIAEFGTGNKEIWECEAEVVEAKNIEYRFDFVLWGELWESFKIVDEGTKTMDKLFVPGTVLCNWIKIERRVK